MFGPGATPAHACYTIASILPPGRFVEGDNGEKKDKKGLLIEALQHEPGHIDALLALGTLVKPGETVALPGDRLLDKTGIFVTARYVAVADADIAKVLAAFAHAISATESVRFIDGRTMNRREMLLEALKVDPRCARAFNFLGESLDDSETTVLLPDGRALGKRALFLEALEIDTYLSSAYTNLALNLAPGETIRPGRGEHSEPESAKDLFYLAWMYDPVNPVSYYNMGSALQPGETVQNPRNCSEDFDQKKFFLCAIELDPSFAAAYQSLAACLAEGETVELLEGRGTMDKKTLLVEALKHEPLNKAAAKSLGDLLKSPSETVRLADGKHVTQLELFARAAAEPSPSPSPAVASSNDSAAAAGRRCCVQ